MTQHQQETGNNEDKLRSLINAGTDIAGSAIGGALGFLVAGPLGGAAVGAIGAVVTAALKKTGSELSDRLLGPRERVRLGGALAIAAAHIKVRIDRGERVRADGFFENQRNGRSDAEEVAESVLLKCQKEAEERKIPYMAYLIGNIAFDSAISPQLAHQIIKAAESMTYRQLCIIKMIVAGSNLPLRDSDYRKQEHFAKCLYEVLYECIDLYNRGFINFGGEVAFGPTDVNPGRMTLQAVGVDIFYQMGLQSIPPADIVPIAKQLSS